MRPKLVSMGRVTKICSKIAIKRKAIKTQVRLKLVSMGGVT